MPKLAVSTLVVLVGGLVAAGCARPIPVLHDGIEEVRYTRCIIKPHDEAVYSANYIDRFGGYAPGSKVQISMFSAIRVDLTINNVPHKMIPASGKFGISTNQIAAFLEKYFVTDLAEIGMGDGGSDGMDSNPLGDPLAAFPEDGVDPGDTLGGEDEGAAAWSFRLDLMKPTVASSVKNGVAAVGMTKEEVYMALGPPLELNFGQVATNLDLNTIMSANKWVYFGSKTTRNLTIGLAGKRVYNFTGGKLSGVEQ
jgi:hypothetical protein